MSDSDPVNVEERLVRIESALAHLQHDVEELNASLTRHFGRMKGFEARFTRIEHGLESGKRKAAALLIPRTATLPNGDVAALWPSGRRRL